MERKKPVEKVSALIFSHSASPRLQYVVDFISQYYGAMFKIIYDEAKYLETPEKLKINYGYHRIAEGEIFIHSHVLLFETTVRPVKIECFNCNGHSSDGYKAFFKTEGDFEFDLFAGIFYLLSRYEEYLPHQKDEFGRYAHVNSIAFKENFLNLPLINIWLEDFRKKISELNTQFLPSPACYGIRDDKNTNSQFQFLPTYDIDMAWSYRNKGWSKNAGAILLLFLSAKFGQAMNRIRVLKRKKQDPFDAYEWMDSLHNEYGLKPLYFFLVAKEKGKYDKNTEISNKEFRSLVRSIASKYEIALHPSWASGDHPELIAKEKQILEEMSEQTIQTSRQHFIRFEFPQTFQKLINAGIVHDHSMGYGSINGFRASVANSFYWFDLKNNISTNLLLHPFCFMDANAYYEQKLSPEQALEELMHYYKLIKEVNGKMITLWHNSFLGSGKEFEGWKEVYLRFIKMISNE